VSHTLTAGRFVAYTLSEYEAREVVRLHGDKIGSTLNRPDAGDVYPALVLRAWSDTCANLKVFLDGEPTLWLTSRSEGEGEGRWAWPTRVEATPAPAAEETPARPPYFSADQD
jgi:hypothetical protein